MQSGTTLDVRRQLWAQVHLPRLMNTWGTLGFFSGRSVACPNCLRLIGLSVALSLPVACAPGNDEPGTRLGDESIASVRIDSRLTIRGPTIVIGSDEPDEPGLLSGVVSALFTRGGDIVVADAGAGTLRLFDSTGRLMRTVGGRGSGPGEFQILMEVVRCTDGSFVARDLGTKLVSYSERLDLIDEFARGSDLTDASLLGCDTRRTLLVLREGDGRVPPDRGLARLPAYVVRADPYATRRDTLVTLSGSDVYFSRRGPYFLDVPLGARARAAVAGGRLVAAVSDHDSVTVIPLDGSQRREIAHGLSRSTIRRGDFARALSERIAAIPFPATRRIVAPIGDEIPQPARFPYWDALTADDAGRIWLRTFEGAGSSDRTWRLFVPGSATNMAVRIPADVQVTDIVRGDLLGIQRDSTGGERVSRFRLGGQ